MITDDQYAGLCMTVKSLQKDNEQLRSELGKCSNIYEITKDGFREMKAERDRLRDALVKLEDVARNRNTTRQELRDRIQAILANVKGVPRPQPARPVRQQRA